MLSAAHHSMKLIEPPPAYQAREPKSQATLRSSPNGSAPVGFSSAHGGPSEPADCYLAARQMGPSNAVLPIYSSPAPSSSRVALRTASRATSIATKLFDGAKKLATRPGVVSVAMGGATFGLISCMGGTLAESSTAKSSVGAVGAAVGLVVTYVAYPIINERWTPTNRFYGRSNY